MLRSQQAHGGILTTLQYTPGSPSLRSEQFVRHVAALVHYSVATATP